MNMAAAMRLLNSERVGQWLLNVLEFASLPTFLVSLNQFQSYQTGRWAEPYYLSTLVAAVVTTFFLLRGVVLNRLAIGINLYLVSGCLAQWFELTSVNQFYGETRAAGMLMWIMIVGVVATTISRAGFIGVGLVNVQRRLLLSLALLVGAVVATGLSYYFIGNRWLSEFVPFVLLFTLQNRLRALAARSLG